MFFGGFKRCYLFSGTGSVSVLLSRREQRRLYAIVLSICMTVSSLFVAKTRTQKRDFFL